MTTLAADVAIGDTQLTIDARMTDVPTGGFAVKVDDELLQVGGVDYRDGLVLALKAPTTAAHSSGATVTQVLDAFTTDATTPFATGGGEQTIRLRTFDVAFDTPGFDDANTGAVLWTPTATEVILDIWVRITEAFAGADAAQLYIGGNVNFDSILNGSPDLIAIGNPPDPGQDFLNAAGSASNVTLDAVQSNLQLNADASFIARSIALVPTEVNPASGTDIVAALFITNGPLTAGSIKVLALTAEAA